MRRIIFIAHGKFQGTPVEKEIRTVFSDSEFTIHFTNHKGHAETLAQEIEIDESTTIVSVGGDGTLHDIVNGLLRKYSESPPACTLAVYPVGSGNDFARTIGAHVPLQEQKRCIMQNVVTETDVLFLESTGTDNKPQHHYCINVGGVGLDGMVARIVNASPKWLNSTMKYHLAVIRSFFQYKKRRAHITVDDTIYVVQTMSVCFANGKFFGNGLCIAPDANTSDGTIAVTIIGDVNVFDYIRYVPILRHGDKIPNAQVTYSQAQTITVTTNAPAPIEADGEFAGYSPVTVTVLPKRLRVLNYRITDHE